MAAGPKTLLTLRVVPLLPWLNPASPNEWREDPNRRWWGVEANGDVIECWVDGDDVTHEHVVGRLPDGWSHVCLCKDANGDPFGLDSYYVGPKADIDELRALVDRALGAVAAVQNFIMNRPVEAERKDAA